MTAIEIMLHHRFPEESRELQAYAEAIQALGVCAEACTACADACLNEEQARHELRACIRLNLDCADVCLLTSRLLVRQTESASALLQAQLHAGVLGCQLCADECERHASQHEHCAACAEICRHAQRRGNHLLGLISGSGVAEPVNPLESPGFSP